MIQQANAQATHCVVYRTKTLWLCDAHTQAIEQVCADRADQGDWCMIMPADSRHADRLCGICKQKQPSALGIPSL